MMIVPRQTIEATRISNSSVGLALTKSTSSQTINAADVVACSEHFRLHE
jgi:hypothetical protein